MPDLRFRFERGELAAIGDFLAIAGAPEERANYANASATVVVSDLDELRGRLDALGARALAPEARSETGRYLYVRHAGGAEVEYVEWTPALVRRIVGLRSCRRGTGGPGAPRPGGALRA